MARGAGPSTNRDLVLDVLVSHPARWFTAHQLAQSAGIDSLDVIRYLVKDLNRAGVIERRGKARLGYSYRLRGTPVEHRAAPDGHVGASCFAPS